ncbi:hypothetical protein [Mesomycoplasma ovipneumoniae]|uniref:hypothetical protein n=1 Tax=Mesomycoplasma ovipneumoniae TaxID=29562 RepID=UPI0029641844|nr:hypothetical protein [Mesomycoplasma ovipneumoniae]MDW2910982.1 hypothetical protein [Mesomycoplasma ovipneumoniae]MDW2918099.1 hypothetical protein [Mesomycoplasma ovipneumoniae]
MPLVAKVSFASFSRFALGFAFTLLIKLLKSLLNLPRLPIFRASWSTSWTFKKLTLEFCSNWLITLLASESKKLLNSSL